MQTSLPASNGLNSPPNQGKLSFGQCIKHGFLLIHFQRFHAVLAGFIGCLLFGLLSALAVGAVPFFLPDASFWIFAVTLIGVELFSVLFIFPFAFGAVTALAAAAYNGDNLTLSQALRSVASKYFTTVLAYGSTFILILLSFVLFILPGFFVLPMLGLVLTISVIEEIPVGKALSRSVALSKGRRWRILGYYFIAGIICSIISSACVPIGMGLFPDEASGALFVTLAISQTLIALAIVPLFSVLVVEYYEAEFHCRSEGFAGEPLESQQNLN